MRAIAEEGGGGRIHEHTANTLLSSDPYLQVSRQGEEGKGGLQEEVYGQHIHTHTPSAFSPTPLQVSRPGCMLLPRQLLVPQWLQRPRV